MSPPRLLAKLRARYDPPAIKILQCGEKAGYCLVGKSECIKEKKGCTCPDCPVTAKMNLKWGYYCIDGSAMEIMEAEKKTG